MSTAAAHRVLVTGANGQVGTELQRTRPEGVELLPVDRDRLDISDRIQVFDAVKSFKPNIIINAAAYTAVDQAEREPELAYKINRDGAANLAEAAHTHGARLIHISTDYVFDGTQSTPYKPDDTPNPINVYGASKLGGEQAVTERTKGAALIVRTAWVYSATGNNFVKTMLRLLRERDEVRVICDQIGTPTHAAGLAQALWRFTELSDLRGIYHWTDAGVASWYDLASAINEMLRLGNQIPRCTQILPIRTAEYPSRAKRPHYGVLDKSSAWAITGPAKHWHAELTIATKAMISAVNAS